MTACPVLEQGIHDVLALLGVEGRGEKSRAASAARSLTGSDDRVAVRAASAHANAIGISLPNKAAAETDRPGP